MVEEKKNREEILADIIGKPVVNGFRKGITKKDILKQLTDEDWKHIDGMKEADERKRVNLKASQIYVRNDQARQEVENTKIDVKKLSVDALQMGFLTAKNQADILAGKTEQKNDEGKEITVEELSFINRKIELNIRKIKNMLISNLSKLYTFVGTKGLDKKPIFTEEEYDKIVEQVETELKTIGHNLLG